MKISQIRRIDLIHELLHPSLVGEGSLGALLLRDVVLERLEARPQLALVEEHVGRGAPRRHRHPDAAAPARHKEDYLFLTTKASARHIDIYLISYHCHMPSNKRGSCTDLRVRQSWRREISNPLGSVIVSHDTRVLCYAFWKWNHTAFTK